jgi:hypothetical protein
MLIARLRVRLVALAATITLLAFAGSSKLSAFGLAVMARHFRLALSAGRADNAFEDSALRLVPRAGFGPALGCNRERGFCFSS